MDSFSADVVVIAAFLLLSFFLFLSPYFLLAAINGAWEKEK